MTGETSTGLGWAAETCGYNTMGRFTSNGAKVLSYDSADNLAITSDGATQTYDVANQVKTRTLGTAVTNYSYDSRGNRTPASGATLLVTPTTK